MVAASSVEIIAIRSDYDSQVARLIQEVMTEFGCVGSGYAIEDPEVEAMSQSYNSDRAQYFVIVDGDRVVGGAGFAPLKGATSDICELRKMYFYSEARGRGLGSQLLELLLTRARQAGYNKCYLETTERMLAAQSLYKKHGFEKLCAPIGSTGHFACESHFLKEL